MKIRFLLLLLCLPLLQLAQNEKIPYELELVEVTPANWPGLHSFAFASWQGRWIIIAGRTNGLHGFFPFTGFPTTQANHHIWLMDPHTLTYSNFDVENWPAPLADPLKASNPQYTQLGNQLYITGGYGKDTLLDAFITFPSLTVVNLDTLIARMDAQQDPRSAFRQLRDSLFQVCGGEMHELNGELYLFGGHNFAGLYSQSGQPSFTQSYTNELRKIAIGDTAGQLYISSYAAVRDSGEFHRRDYNLAPMIMGGEEGLAAFGGVFQPHEDAPYRHPIYMLKDSIWVDSSYEQQMSQYTCAVLPVYDSSSQTMYHSFFGGISLYTFDEKKDTLKRDDRMPFINDITTLIRKPSGETEEVLLSIRFDELLGSNAKFILDEAVPHYDNKVVRLDQIRSRSRVGYVFGGIKASIPNITPSSASRRLFEVYVTPRNVLSIYEETSLSFSISPNPCTDFIQIRWPEGSQPQTLHLYNLLGQLCKSWEVPAQGRKAFYSMADLPAGMYLLEGKLICRLGE